MYLHIRTFCLILFIAFAATLLQCSLEAPVSSGGTGSETVIGKIVHDDGSPAGGTVVTLLPYNYNPSVENTRYPILSDTTDSAGCYTFTISNTGIYTIEALHMTQRTRAMVTGVKVIGDTVLIEEITLKKPGQVEIIFPDTVDTAEAYVYIQGTTFYRRFSDGVYLNDGSYSLRLDSIPAFELPAIIINKQYQNEIPIILTSPVIVPSNETVVIDISNSSVKPLWRFSLVAGISEQTADKYGGMDSVQDLTAKYVAGVNNKFNAPGVFNGIIRFSFDSLYQFNKSVVDEIKDTIPGFDYRLLFDHFSDWSLNRWYSDSRTVCMAMDTSMISDMFGQTSIDAGVYNFAQARGCIPVGWVKVEAANNPVNGMEFKVAEESIMNWPYGEDRWSELSINMINYYANNIFYSPGIIGRAFPSSMGVRVNSTVGVPLSGAELTFYGVKLESFSVDSIPIFSGITDSTGEFVFSQNPYNPASEADLRYHNILISTVHQSDTVYTWKPVFEAVNAWFANPDSSYRMVVHF